MYGAAVDGQGLFLAQSLRPALSYDSADPASSGLKEWGGLLSLHFKVVPPRLHLDKASSLQTQSLIIDLNSITLCHTDFRSGISIQYCITLCVHALSQQYLLWPQESVFKTTSALYVEDANAALEGICKLNLI